MYKKVLQEVFLKAILKVNLEFGCNIHSLSIKIKIFIYIFVDIEVEASNTQIRIYYFENDIAKNKF